MGLLTLPGVDILPIDLAFTVKYFKSSEMKPILL